MASLIRDEEESIISGTHEQPIITVVAAPTASNANTSPNNRQVLHLVEQDNESTTPPRALRRSTRNRYKPLKYCENERQIFGPKSESGVLGKAIARLVREQYGPPRNES